MISREWKEVWLGKVCDTNCSNYSNTEKWDYVNYLDTGNITENKINSIQFIDLAKDKLPSRARRKVKPNDIVYSTVRPNQKHYGIIKKPFENMLVSTGFTTIRAKKGMSYPQFIYYFLAQNKIVETLHTIAEQQVSTYPSIKATDIENIVLKLPSLPEQKSIATTLSCLDDMIELNNHTNQVLKEMTQAIFKHWFVDFEFPNEDGQPYKSSGGAMVDSELGEMPAGWRVGTINDIAKDIVCGKTPPTKDKDNYGDYMLFITIPDMHNKVYVTKSERYLSRKGVNTQLKKTLPKNSICVSCIATPGLVCLTSEESQTNQQINSIICKDDTSYFYVYLSVCLLSEHIKMLGSSGSATNNLNKTQFSKVNILIDNNEIQQQFHTIVEPIFELIKENEFETATLVFLRDTLLPKLMSGEIRVPVEEVV